MTMRHFAFITVLLIGSTVVAARPPDPCSLISTVTDAKLTLSTQESRTAFREGEIIPLVLSFTSTVEKRYRVADRNYDRSGRLNIDTYCIEPEARDPLSGYFSTTLAFGGGLGGEQWLSGSNSSTASFVVPAAAPAGSSLQFMLTVTDANSETDSVPVTVFVLTNMQLPFVYFHARQVTSVVQEAEDATLESPLSGSVRTEFDTTYNIFQFNFSGSSLFDQMQIGPSSMPIVPGSYSSSVANPNWFNESHLFCGTDYTWTLVIHEAAAASDGTAQIFSADFTYQCLNGSAPPYSGSVRVNSAWPLP